MSGINNVKARIDANKATDERSERTEWHVTALDRARYALRRKSSLLNFPRRRLRFASLHADELRYLDQWAQWLRWDGKRWAIDQLRKVYSFSRELCRVEANRAATARNTSTPIRLANSKTVAGVVSLARCDSRRAATIDEWDADPWLLNTPGGVVDLRTGECRPARLPREGGMRSV